MKNSKKKQKTKEEDKLPINKIMCGDVFHELVKIPDDSIDLIVTSPPYFQQRDYTEGEELEIGNEEYIINYLHTLVEVFSECLRVCKIDGNIVFNLGDKYLKGDLQLIPYRFAILVKERFSPTLKLVNDITWVKSNPTPRQYDRRLVSATEPFFHFVKSPNYYYDRDAFQYEEIEKKKITDKKGKNYEHQILKSDLTAQEQLQALIAVSKARLDITEGKITDFRMKIRGVHKLAFGGQPGGRNNEIKNKGFTVIEMTGKKMKRDVIQSPVDNNKGIDHPAIFPLQATKEMVSLLSPKGSIVLDPFCGSGTTCLAAKELGRNYIGIDLSEKYCKISRDRLK